MWLQNIRQHSAKHRGKGSDVLVERDLCPRSSRPDASSKTIIAHKLRECNYCDYNESDELETPVRPQTLYGREDNKHTCAMKRMRNIGSLILFFGLKRSPSNGDFWSPPYVGGGGAYCSA